MCSGRGPVVACTGITAIDINAGKVVSIKEAVRDPETGYLTHIIERIPD